MRVVTLYLSVALALAGGLRMTHAQDLDNGQRLSKRWCSECHAIGPAAGKFSRASSFTSIAAKETISAEMIASFLLMPHATMRNLPLSRQDAQDIAAFIMGMRK